MNSVSEVCIIYECAYSLIKIRKIGEKKFSVFTADLKNRQQKVDHFYCSKGGRALSPFFGPFISQNMKVTVQQFLLDVLHTVYPATPNAGMFYQRGYKHLRRGNTQGKKTCNSRIPIVPISNITFQTLCKRAYLRNKGASKR